MEDITKILGLDEDTIFDDVKTYVRSLKDTMFEKEQLKKQLNKANKYDLIQTQQKEFIKYLEDEIKTLEKDILETVDDMDIYMKQVKSLIIEEILQKYKSIIGVSDENNIK